MKYEVGLEFADNDEGARTGTARAVEAVGGNASWWRDFVERFTYHSNAIEGSVLGLGETRLLLRGGSPARGRGGAVVGATSRAEASEREKCVVMAENHRRAVDLAFSHIDLTLTQELIRNVAVQVNGGLNKIDGYRHGSVSILGASHEPPPAREVPQQMMVAIHEHNVSPIPNAFEVEARFHVAFEDIHPFGDGNGRTGRILINHGLMRRGIPPVVITLDLRDEYLRCIGEHDYDGLTDMLRGLSRHEARLMGKAGRGDG